ncbi:MAG: 50S ribosomal protein L7/L12 [Clostridia bacterium]|nr:50S ribosomal protein L7/L12 [Clostridia bacterium]
MADINKMIEEIKGMTVLELNNLVKALEEEFGVSAAAPVAVAAAPAVGGTAAPAQEEKTEFTVVLKAAGPNKLQVVKTVREITGLPLGEAKALVDNAPKDVKENIAKEEADKIAEQLKAIGAEIELK